MEGAAVFHALSSLRLVLLSDVNQLEKRCREAEEGIAMGGEDGRWETRDGEDEGEMKAAEQEGDHGDDLYHHRHLEKLGVELEAARQRLGLVEATEQQLAGQGEAALPESGPAHLFVEVRA
jgi:hypothetical protein